MFGAIMTNIIVLGIFLILVVIALTAIKLGIYSVFDFMYGKGLKIKYILFYILILIVTTSLSIAFRRDVFVLTTLTPVSAYIPNILLISGISIGVLFVFSSVELLIIYPKHFDYESKGRYITSLFVSLFADALFVFLASFLLFYLLVLLLT